MDKLKKAKILLTQIGMPPKQQSMICVFTLLAMANVRRDTPWSEATNEWIRIHDIIAFTADRYGVVYAENSRETFRKQALHPFRTAALIEDNGLATNSPNYRYRLTTEFLGVIKELTDDDSITSDSDIAIQTFMSNHESLTEIYASKKRMQKMPVRINQQEFTFSPGKHNELQKDIIEEFAPRFAPNSECLYVGDTIQKDLVKNVEKLSELGFEITLHDKMPDVVLYREDKNWIYFIESITSVGPMDSKRIVEIETMTKNVTAGKIYVSAFPDFSTFKKFSDRLAWETEVWIADMPDHMIHLNGDKFLGPRNYKKKRKVK
ncbi:MAG: BsuBI/PstI family type II restriction endonuclease [Muribaculaceae bacterium]